MAALKVDSESTDGQLNVEDGRESSIFGDDEPLRLLPGGDAGDDRDI